MAPEIVDLISDDEDVDVPATNNTPTLAQGHQSTAPGLRTVNPAPLSHTGPIRPGLLSSASTDTRSSTASSHTEHNSPPGHEGTISTLSPLPPATSALMPRDNGKGKARASPIPEIDLSQDTDDDGDDYDDNDNDNTPAAYSDEAFGYGNGEFTEDEALRQAIALSLQEQSSPQHGERDGDENANAGISGSSSTPTRPSTGGRSTSIRTTGRTVSPPPSARSANEKPFRNWYSSDRRVTPTPTAIPSIGAETAAITATTSLTTPDTPVKATSDAEQKRPTSGFSLATLDRKHMEAERLARLKRKYAGTQDEQEGPGAKVSRVMQSQATRDLNMSPPPVRHRQKEKEVERMRESSSQLPGSSNLSAAVEKPTIEKPLSITDNGSVRPLNTPHIISLDDEHDEHTSTPTLYPEGIALRTHIAGHPSTQTISFPELISPSLTLASALLSSFIWNFDWLFPHFETRRTKFLLVMHAKSADERESLRKDFAEVPNVRLTFPPMEGNVNCMHSKLMLLFYKNEQERDGTAKEWKGGQRCRIVVPTANLVDFDWGVGGFMENTVWLIDLPLKGKSIMTEETETLFEKSLKQFLKAQTVPDDVLRKLDQFNFSRTARYGFVHTIGGIHSGPAWRTTGLCGLGRAVTELGLATKDPVHLDYVTSSVGSLNDEFMNSMYLAALGDDGLTEYTRRVDKRTLVDKHGSWKENFRFYFPSDQTVRTSNGGPHKAGTICFSTKWWQNQKFPRSNMRDCISDREGLLMHNKLLFVRYTLPVERFQPKNIGWAYVGSSNLSESAWGRLVQDKGTREPRLNCRNWECGVIIPLPAKRSESGKSALTSHNNYASLESFRDFVPVPMRYPGDSMEKKKPWTMFDG